MDTKNEILEFGKSKLSQWKGMIEELQLQLSLGKAEARDAIKSEQKNLSKFFNQQKAQFKQAETRITEQRISLVRKLTELNAALRDAQPKTKRSFESQRKQNMRLVHEVEYLIRTVSKEATDRIENQLEALKELLDTYRIQLALSEFPIKENMTRSQDALIEELNNSITILDKENSKDGQRFQHFMDEISQSLDHLKEAFSEITR